MDKNIATVVCLSKYSIFLEILTQQFMHSLGIEPMTLELVRLMGSIPRICAKNGLLHKTFANKALFPSHVFKRTKSNTTAHAFPGNQTHNLSTNNANVMGLIPRKCMNWWSAYCTLNAMDKSICQMHKHECKSNTSRFWCSIRNLFHNSYKEQNI